MSRRDYRDLCIEQLTDDLEEMTSLCARAFNDRDRYREMFQIALTDVRAGNERERRLQKRLYEQQTARGIAARPKAA